MIIKKNIFLFLLMMSVSFSALSGIKLTSGPDSGSIYSSVGAYTPKLIGSCLTGMGGYGAQWFKFSYARVKGSRIRFSGSSYTGSDCSKTYNSRDDAYVSFVAAECEAPASYNEQGLCEEPPLDECAELKGDDAPFPSGPVPDDGLAITASRLYCVLGSRCEALKGYRAVNGSLVRDAFYTGEHCPPDGDYEQCQYFGGCGGETPPDEEEIDEPFAGCKKPYVESPFVCPKDTDGDGIPNEDAEFDDAANCEHDSSGKFSCSGGSFDNIPTDPTTPTEPTDPDGNVTPPSNIPDAGGDPATYTPPEEVDPVPDVVEPDLTPDSNGDVVSSITSMNRDFNKALTDLNIDINKTQSNINNQLERLNQNVVNNSNATVGLEQTNIDIYENTKQLIQGVESAVHTSNNDNVAQLQKGFRDLSGEVSSIGDSLDGLTNVDTSSAGISGTCIQSDTCTGFYTSNYPDGLSGMANKHFQEIKENTLDGFVNTFGNLDLSNAQRPNFSIPILDFGEFNITNYINLDWILGFVRFCLIFTAIATARKNILGG
ncbi:hypothetical protein [Vibrio sp. 99-70-13A1]|uniref:hypothetical protein n=1 Tax=Vibrio sp. 99-70-13A1 TaxID=2607601 RepID=UPI0014934785|nr:hypothetical protein [Vibrio sp. 99-70-13A1]NOH96291.1 hypothetical protein [Vibrio sp. 99-70-13A1]